jgi:hypothetical protein
MKLNNKINIGLSVISGCLTLYAGINSLQDGTLSEARSYFLIIIGILLFINGWFSVKKNSFG